MNAPLARLWRPDLDPGSNNPLTQRSLKLLGACAPWCAPPEVETPPVQAGRFPILTCAEQGERASLWLMGSSALSSAARRRTYRLSPGAQDAVRDALAATNRTVPIMWRPLGELRRRFLHDASAIFLNGASSNPTAPRESVVDGGSLGLAVGLAAFSALLDLPCPDDLLASATLDAQGATGSVQGLEIKLHAIALCAPRVRRLLVHASDEGAAQHAAGALRCPIAIIPVRSLAGAIHEAWSHDAIADHIERLLSEPQTREAIAGSLFHIALSDLRSALAWEPIHRAAEQALPRLDDTPDTAWRLRYASAVAQRYSGGMARMELPDAGPDAAHFRALPLPHRLHVAAHITQSAAWCGSPDPDRTRAWAAALLPGDPLDYTEGHLKLRGALGRLLSTLGEPCAALEHQLAVGRGWHALRAWSEMSYSISEWLRLASLLDPAELPPEGSLAEAEQTFLRVCAVDHTLFTDFMSHYRSRARLLRPDDDRLEISRPAAIANLRAHWSDANLNVNLRWASLRWLLIALRANAQRDDAVALLREARSDPRRDEPIPAIQLALIDIDAALERGDHQRARMALEALHTLRPQPTGLLLGAARRAHTPPDAEPAWVARWWP